MLVLVVSFSQRGCPVKLALLQAKLHENITIHAWGDGQSLTHYLLKDISDNI